MQKLLASGLMAGGLVMIAAGLWHFKEVQIVHVIFGILALLAGFYCLVYSDFYTTDLDQKTGRCYRFTKQSENPHHAKCPRCNRVSPLIVSTTGNPKHRKGVKCGWCGVQWFGENND